MTQLSLKKIYSGKVRDLYEIDDKRMLMVASDRLSAFDVILDDPIPRKGEILTQISNFWFNKLAHIMPNHFTGDSVYDVLPKEEADLVKDRAVVCKRLKPIKIESIVRGYLTGSGLKDYKQTGTICGLKLPEGLVEASKLPEPIFTPSSKEEVGNHDINISYEECEKAIGAELAAQVREKAIALYTEAAKYALTKGIIICDTKFEFGLDENLVYSVIKVESKFRKDAVSHKGAKGLMQISDITREWAKEEMNLGDIDIFDPKTNIKIGCWYLNKLYKEFGRLDLVIAAYNGGSGNVNKWLSDYSYSKDGKSLDLIPFEETSMYVKKVTKNYKMYNKLYSKEG